MRNRRFSADSEGQSSRPAPSPEKQKQEPIKVSFGVYIISLLVVALVIFIVMLVLYLPGYRMSQRIKVAVENSDYVYAGVRVPKQELKKRNVNPLTKEDDLVEILKEMGAKRARAEINPDLTRIPGE